MGMLEQRVLFSNGGSLTDYSKELLDYKSGAPVLAITDTDYLYLGSLLPFNHKYFELGVVNDVASVVSVDIWWAKQWVPAVDVIDYTSIGGKSLAQSGIIRWTTDRLKGWDNELDSEDVTGLTGTVINNMYWVRISWSATLKSTLTMKCIGQKYSKDSDLFAEYPILNNAAWMEEWESGKTSWDEQHWIAADRIAKDLLKGGWIFSKDQILDYELFNEASVQKTAEIIFSGLGDNYIETAKQARASYLSAIKLKRYNIDKNADGNVSSPERVFSTGYMYR